MLDRFVFEVDIITEVLPDNLVLPIIRTIADIGVFEHILLTNKKVFILFSLQNPPYKYQINPYIWYEQRIRRLDN